MFSFLKKNIFYILLFIIFLAFCFTRFYNLDQRIVFGWDQEQFSTQIREIIVNHKLTLLGPRVNNDLGFFLGPYFPYLLIPLFLLTRLHPVALAYLIFIENILFFVLSFFVIKKLFSARHALAFLALWTINFWMQIYDIMPWWILLIPMGAVVTFFSLYKVYRAPKKWFLWVLLGLWLGLFFNMHFQFVFVFIFANIMVFFLLKAKKVSFKNLSFYLGSFVATFAPLMLFDLRHNFLNTHLFLDFFLKGTDAAPKDYLSFVPVLVNFFQPFTIIKSTWLMFGFYLLMLASFVILTLKKKNFFRIFYTGMAIIWLLTPVVFYIYGRRPSEYYFLYLMPFIFIALSDLLITFKKTSVLFAIVILLAVGNFNFLKKNLRPDYTGLYYKDQVAQYLKNNLAGKRFNVSYDGVSVDTGFPYLLDYYEVTQSGDFKDPLVEISFPARKKEFKIGDFSITIPEKLK